MRFIALFLLITLTLSACAMEGGKIHLVDAKMANAVDENLMPVKIMDVFPKSTSKVSCWIKWEDAKINTQVLASWHYLTDDIHILDYTLNIPKKEGTGSVTLAMPDGKNLPSGSYKIDLILGKRVLRSLEFKVE